MPDFIRTQGDLRPSLVYQLQNEDGTAPDLTGATVECRVQPADRTRQASVTVATIVNARGGYVSHDWNAYEMQSPGTLLVQFRRTDGPNVQTWPADRYLEVLVVPGLTPPSLTTPAPSPPPGPIPFAGAVDTVNTTGTTLAAVDAFTFADGKAVYVREGNGDYWRIVIGKAFAIDANHINALNLPGGQWVKENPSEITTTDSSAAEHVLDTPQYFDFDDILSAITVAAHVTAGLRVSGGAGTFRLRMGGTLGQNDGTIVATATVSATSSTPTSFVAAPFAIPSGIRLLQLTMQNDTAGKRCYIQGATVAVGKVT